MENKKQIIAHKIKVMQQLYMGSHSEQALEASEMEIDALTINRSSLPLADCLTNMCETRANMWSKR